ncbi:MAG: tRNA (N(6)-L-threonylcarbamoyladenosine(37)-C(2))-methylthiotransferase MtaB [Fimbriimonadaceae bacterium]|nr:tRNA (N(6)-L-threonylcarbamoyladenosine(37)-C(2))-methylthiotransferase MtaB [Fimbriimonadaceae bacterium]
MPTAAFTTLGCKVNQYETQRILESFEEAGFDAVPFDQPADVYVINTCSVTSVAESKSRYTIRKAARTNPDAKVVVTGCASQMALNKREPMEGAHVVVPNPQKLEALSYLLHAFPGLEPPPGGPRARPAAFAGRTRATLKVQDGCSVFCSYCSIPFTRPVMSSRPWREVIEEAERLASMGYREVVLTGVLIGAYGPDTGSGGPDFEDLVERLCAVDGLERIRISSIEMRQVTPRLIERVAAGGKVVPHLHVPLQSGDSGVLADMNRPYTQRDYLDLCESLYAEIPDLSLTTDIMVGFPTESEERFQSSVAVCEQAKYLKAHLFRFSPRHGTPADQWGDPVAPEEKVRRSQVLSQVTSRTGEGHAQRFLGRTLRVLVEGKRRDGLLGGLTDNYLEVRFAGSPQWVGSLVHVHLSDHRDGMLYGELAAAPSPDRRALSVRN